METGKVLPGAHYKGGMGTPVKKHGKQLESTNRSLTFPTQQAVAFLEDKVPGVGGTWPKLHWVFCVFSREAGSRGSGQPFAKCNTGL